jgi:hypothetical protein
MLTDTLLHMLSTGCARLVSDHNICYPSATIASSKLSALNEIERRQGPYPPPEFIPADRMPRERVTRKCR